MESKEKFYDSIAENFDSIMNMYDTNRRLGVIFKDFLGNENLNNKTLLDGGCGTEWFTKSAIERGAIVTSIDISPKLVGITHRKNPGVNGITCSILELPFKDNSFDYVISSDVIEHTPDPYKGVDEMIRVLKPKGKLCITVPNKTFWYFSLFIANLFKLRKYQGFENWVSYFKLKKYLILKKVDIIEYKGIHLFPFVISPLNNVLYKLAKVFDKMLGFMMVNIAVCAIKR